MPRILCLILAAIFGLAAQSLSAREVIPLGGAWRFALDRDDVGTNQSWFSKTLDQKIQLPGILEAQGYGDPIGISTPWVLSLYDHFWYLRADYAADTNAGRVKVPFLCQPPAHFTGVAWYQREVTVPANWDNRCATLFLERPHWKSTVWVDDREIGSDLSLCTPHEYPLGLLPPGPHRLTIRVDNRMILPYRLDAHSVSDSLDDAWNGIVGKIELRARPQVCIDGVQVYPDARDKRIKALIRLGNLSGRPASGDIQVAVEAGPGAQPLQVPAVSERFSELRGTNTIIEKELDLGTNAELWSEFSPALYHLRVAIRGRMDKFKFADETTNGFGLRDFHAEGTQFILNGRPVYFRGTHCGGDFPLTGYPATDAAAWEKIFLTCRNYGLNHVRFHSWCPPEAAFAAADELGIYLQVECGMWNDISPASRMEAMLYQETERILRDFGNHPSLMLISAMNEAHGNWPPALAQWVRHFRGEDPRHLYTPDTGFPIINSPAQPLNGGADYLAVAHLGMGALRGPRGWFGGDYGDAVAGATVPIIGHEVGQWCAYPDFDLIKKFTGFMRPGNFEIFRDSAAAHGLFAVPGNGASARPGNRDFARASGRFQLACYKEEVEANLRTPGLSGFQLLDLHDYTGQGTALVGLLDPFWESKGYASADEFKEFCNSTVPLARLTTRTFTTADKLDVPVEVAHFGNEPLEVATAGWQIIDARDEVVAQGDFAVTNIPIGKNFRLGTASADLARLPAPGQYQLRVVIGQKSHVPAGRFGVLPPFINEWNFWLYPDRPSPVARPAGVLETSSFEAAVQALQQGKKVLFTPRNADLDWNCPPLARVPVFWNALMGPTWGRMLGLWCDTNSPALAEFPTAPHCDWQWTELLHNTRAINLDRLPAGLTPIVSAIDDWNRNDKLGLIFEAKAGSGKLLVCAAGLNTSNAVAAQLRHSLLDYLASDKFQPATEIALADLAHLRFDTLVMKKLGATAIADGRSANEIIDGDPNTFWSSADSRGRGPKPPHIIQIAFPHPMPVSGIVLMPRQNQREHQGDIREYTLEYSEDAMNWQALARGELPSSFEEKNIPFGRTVSARYLKLTARSGFGNDSSAALAELAVIYAGPKLGSDQTENPQYRNVRTASPDIDAPQPVEGPKP